MKKIAMLCASLLICGGTVSAQIERNDWSCGLVLQSDNFVYNLAANVVKVVPLTISEDAAEFYENNFWWIPEIMYRANVVQKMEFANGKATVYPKAWGFSGFDWGLRNYSVGYHVGYLSKLFPLGFDFEVDYVQDGYKIKMPLTENKMSIIKRMISTTALLRIRLMSYHSHTLNPVLEVGGSYDYAFHYHDKNIDDKDAVNNGFSGIIGLGITNTENHFTWTIRYTQPFYDFYNKDFKYDGVPVFEGSKSTFGRLGFAISYGF